MNTSTLSLTAEKTIRPRWFGWLETCLAIAAVALLVQVVGPTILQAWQEWPQPGQQIAIAPLVTAPDGQQWQVRSWVYFPEDYSSQRRFPLLLYLHGAGERGDDLNFVLRGGPPTMLASGKQLPMIVVSPQCRPDATWESEQLLALLDYVQAKYSVDPQRVYVSGFSMGGYGTWRLCAAAPDRFAAAVPVAGGGNVHDAERLTNLPIWAFHGDRDEVVPFQQSEKMVEAVQSLGDDARLTILKNQGHGICNEVFHREDLFDWLIEQSCHSK